jgi:hypothetical protein
MDTITTTERTPGGRLKLALHSNKTRAEKLALLKRADAIIRGGYKVEIAERRTKINIKDLRAWSVELGYPFASMAKKARYQNANTI